MSTADEYLSESSFLAFDRGHFHLSVLHGKRVSLETDYFVNSDVPLTVFCSVGFISDSIASAC